MGQPGRDLQQDVLDLLGKMRSMDALKTLICTHLSYDYRNQTLSRRPWTLTATNALAEDPLLVATAGDNDSFHVIYARLASPTLRLDLAACRRDSSLDKAARAALRVARTALVLQCSVR